MPDLKHHFDSIAPRNYRCRHCHMATDDYNGGGLPAMKQQDCPTLVQEHHRALMKACKKGGLSEVSGKVMWGGQFEIDQPGVVLVQWPDGSQSREQYAVQHRPYIRATHRGLYINVMLTDLNLKVLDLRMGTNNINDVHAPDRDEWIHQNDP